MNGYTPSPRCTLSYIVKGLTMYGLPMTLIALDMLKLHFFHIILVLNKCDLPVLSKRALSIALNLQNFPFPPSPTEKKKSQYGRFFLGRGHSKRLIFSNNDKISIHTCSFPRGRNASAVVRIFKEFCIKKDSCNSYNINQYNIEEREICSVYVL